MTEESGIVAGIAVTLWIIRELVPILLKLRNGKNAKAKSELATREELKHLSKLIESLSGKLDELTRAVGRLEGKADK